MAVGRFRSSSESGNSPGGLWFFSSAFCSSSLCRGSSSCTAGGSFPARTSRSGQIWPSLAGRSLSCGGTWERSSFPSEFPLTGIEFLNALMIFVQIGLYWLAIKWFVANIASNGQPLGLGFSGSYWGYLGWNIVSFVSVITIIGLAWVYTAQTRWMCRYV